MKQILQDLKSGDTRLVEVPCPKVRPHQLLIRTTNTLVSAGTERMLVDFGKANVIDKARQQPEKVRMVLDKIKTDGFMPTLQAVRSKLDQPLPMGYCNVGAVLELGPATEGFSVGERVLSNGKHAEVVSVPKNLCAKVPDNVSDEEASFTVIGAIALQGIRLVQPSLGEAVVVTGLGLIGLMAVQLLKAQGCRVLGIDFDSAKCALARRFGADTVDLSKGQDALQAAQAFSRGRGVDAVIITASTKSNEPVHQAALMCRKRGRVVLVGVVGLELSRADFYEKELSFQVSCSYGPGRYDPAYEEGGQDYPLAFVRWTEQRNFEAVLDMLSAGQLDVKPLISHRFDLDEAAAAYEVVSGKEPSLGILLQYPTALQKSNTLVRQQVVPLRAVKAGASPVVLSVIGSGNYATQVLIPAFKKTKAKLHSVVSSTGVSSSHAAKKFSFAQASTDTQAALTDKQVNTLVITTRHNSHARLVCEALKQGKHVFVEKPLALTLDELDQIEAAYQAAQQMAAPPLLMVGFNRRFSPLVVKLKQLLANVSAPKSFIMTVNAGPLPLDHWIYDPQVGGGRLLSEGCHFIDLLRFLSAAPVVKQQAMMMGRVPGVQIPDDKLSIQLAFADGSLGTIHYLGNGDRSFPKERLEVFAAGGILQLDNFRKLRGFGWPGFKKLNLRQQDKGNRACVKAFVEAITTGQASPIAVDELLEVARLSCKIDTDLRTGDGQLDPGT